MFDTTTMRAKHCKEFSFATFGLKQIGNTRLLVSNVYQGCYTINSPEYIQKYAVQYFTLDIALSLLTDDERCNVFFNMEKLT